MNPLFPDEPNNSNSHTDAGYLLPRQEKRLDRLGEGAPGKGADAAVELIRRKIDALYADEPDAKKEEELFESTESVPRSRHQQFMQGLSTSGRSLAEIQTAWHTYYIALSDDDKRQVWQEFYAANNQQPSSYTSYVHKQPAAPKAHHYPAKQPEPPTVIAYKPRRPAGQRPLFSQPEPTPAPSGVVVVNHEASAVYVPQPTDNRSFATVKKHVLHTVRNRTKAQAKAKEHFQSLIFGLGTGALVLLVVLFSFFNEVVIAPFIHPGNHAEATPIILSTDGVAPTDKNEVIIPKINVELPFITGTSTNEADIENTLENGVAHYPSTALPGQLGNAAFFGHSSNNIFNKGRYKFAFVLLHEMEPGDIFYLTNNGKVYTYKIFQKKVVEPSETWVLNPVEGHAATAILITCDPPGTSKHRLVVWGDQVSPDPNGNPAAAAPVATDTPKELPSNSPTLWSRFYHWATPF
ncbi:MAG TPA: sortase [Candidatus Saccharimonadales bacterium]|jgi:LPXTG-site transpeptidase (sortase) family protein|nr:sortase [Candidatus Saccharimonadales bacterium]